MAADDAALAQLRDLVAALGNWYDFAAFNEIVRRDELARLHMTLEALRRSYDEWMDALISEEEFESQFEAAMGMGK